MATFNAAAGAATLQINANVGAVSGNQSRVDWNLYLYCYNGSSRHLDSTVAWNTNINGSVYSGAFGYDFRGVNNKLIAAWSTWVTHDGNGYATITVTGFKGVDGASAVADNVTVSGTFDLTRIPKPPAQNGAPVVSNLLPTSALFAWPASANNNGADIDQYLLRINKVTPVESAGYVDYPVTASTLSQAVSGLIPGTQYYAVVYAHNGYGYSVRSAETAFKTPSGMYVWNGAEHRPSEVTVWNGTAWKTSTEILVWNGTVWKTAT